MEELSSFFALPSGILAVRRGRMFDVDLALLSCLYDFKCPAAMKILQKEAGAQMFYEPATPWLIVLPVNHILGRVPLMKAYLGGSDSPQFRAHWPGT